MPESSDPGYLN